MVLSALSQRPNVSVLSGHCSDRTGGIMAFQIFVVEAHPAVRKAYAVLFREELDLELCGAVSSGAEALILIPQCQPHIVLVSLALHDMNGLILCQHVYEMQPTLSILIVSSRETTFDTLRKSPLFVPTIKGYLHKEEAADLLVPTIRQLLTL